MKRLIFWAGSVIFSNICFAQVELIDDLEHCKWRDGKKIQKAQCEDLYDQIYDISDQISKFKSTLDKDLKDWQRNSQEKSIADLIQVSKELMDRAFKVRNIKTNRYESCGEPKFVGGLVVDFPCDPDTPGHLMPCTQERTEVKDGKTSLVITVVPCAPGQQKTIEQVQREEADAKKRKCGKDYMAIRIGMSIDRLEECNGAAYVTETVSKGGVVETYRTVFDWVYVQNGRVVGYTKRKF